MLPPAQGSDAVIVGSDLSDDAAVVRLPGDDRRLLVLTTDTIAPLVDEPEIFGRIAAANALSDVYAMGGRPLYALNLVFFPDKALPLTVLQAIMRGASAACAEVGVPIVGGHSVRNDDLLFGLAVTGEVAADGVLSNRGASAGEALVLSKALGTGVIGTAIKKDLASELQMRVAIDSMCRLNREALEIGRRHGITAATDVTGFGLLGHLRNILRGSALDAVVELSALPLLPGALELAADGHMPGGSKANLETMAQVLRPSGVVGSLAGETEIRLQLAADAQTSGGLLMSLPAPRADAAVAELRDSGHAAARVGELRSPAAPDGGAISIVGA